MISNFRGKDTLAMESKQEVIKNCTLLKMAANLPGVSPPLKIQLCVRNQKNFLNKCKIYTDGDISSQNNALSEEQSKTPLSLFVGVGVGGVITNDCCFNQKVATVSSRKYTSESNSEMNNVRHW